MAACIVSYVDTEGLRHAVEVEAESLYEAAILEDLPADLRKLSPDARKQEIEKRLAERRELRAHIASLSKTTR